MAARMRQNIPMTARFYYSVTQAAYSPDGIANYSLRTVPTIISGRTARTWCSPRMRRGAWLAVVVGLLLQQRHAGPRVQDWNVTLEKEIMPNTVARAGYFGNHTSRLEQLYQYNSTTPAYIWYSTTGLALPTGEFANVGTKFLRPTSYGSSSVGKTPDGPTPTASTLNWSAATPKASPTSCST